MKITLLGTGDAGGVPTWGCECQACLAASADPARRRGPCCATVEIGDTRVLIDAGITDLARRFRRDELAAVVLTHFHVDHVQGLFHLRWGVGDPLPVYCPDDEDGCADLYRHPGLLAFCAIDMRRRVRIGGLEFTPIPMQHSKLTYGYMIKGDGRAAYLTDTRGLGADAARALREFSPEVVVIDAKYPPGHPSPKGHNTIDEALALGFDSGASRVILTHLGHDADCWLINNPDALPRGAEIGRDGQTIETTRAAAWT